MRLYTGKARQKKSHISAKGEIWRKGKKISERVQFSSAHQEYALIILWAMLVFVKTAGFSRWELASLAKHFT